jgi:hypothetical protein
LRSANPDEHPTKKENTRRAQESYARSSDAGAHRLETAEFPVPNTQHDAAGNHPDSAADQYRKTCNDQGVFVNIRRAGRRTGADKRKRRSNDKNARRAQKSNTRSPDTKFDLLERVSVDSAWRAWRNLNTGSV